MQIGIGRIRESRMIGVKTDLPESGMLRTSIERAPTDNDTARARIEALSRMLMAAAKLGKAEEAARLLDMGANPNATDDIGWTPLHYTVRNNNPKIAKLLIQHNANPNATDNIGRMPLHYAARDNNPKIAELLLNNGADPDVIDSIGQTQLYYAINYSSPAVEELLVKHGANPDVVGNNNRPQVHHAARDGRRAIEGLIRTANRATPTKESDTTWIEELNEARRLLEDGRRGSAKKVLERIWLKEAAVLIKNGNREAGYERFGFAPNKLIRMW